MHFAQEKQNHVHDTAVDDNDELVVVVVAAVLFLLHRTRMQRS